MRHIVYLCLLKFVGTPCSSFGIRDETTTEASNPRSVNVALETVLEFDGNNDIAFIDTVQNFLNKLKTTITRNRAREFDNDEANKPKTVNHDDKKKFIFTNFLAETVTVLKSFKDNDLRAFFDMVGEQINAWQTRKDIHVTDQLGFRRIIYRNLQRLKNLPANDIRKKLNALSNKLKHSDGQNGLVAEFLNYLYKKESEDNLSNFLNKLKLYRKGSRRNNYSDLKTIIRQGILAIIDPLLNLNSKTMKSISNFYNKYIATDSVDDDESKVKKKESKHAKHGHNRNKIFNGNDILDYIEDHVKIIDKRLSTLGIKAKIRYIPKEITSHKHVTIRPATEVTTGKIEENIIRPRDKKKKVHFDNTDVSIGREPVLINLNDDPELKSVEEYLSTTKRPKRYKKSTKRKLTPKKDYLRLKTTEKFRKAFRTTAVSAEGLSIEHFGSLFGREFHRKVNGEDSFVQNTVQSTPTVTNKAFTKDVTDISKEVTKDKSINKEKNEYWVEKQEVKNISKIYEDKSKSTEIIEENPRGITDSIKIQGDIIIKTSEATTVKKIDMTTPKPVTTTKRSYNVSIVTKYFNIQTLKPTIYLRGHDTSNETDSKPQTTSTLAIANKTDNITKKPTNDGLENEIEGIMERYNSTPAAFEFKNFIDKAEMNSAHDKKVRDQMKMDLERLLAPPTTKATVTELFTDPFDDLDQGADIL